MLCLEDTSLVNLEIKVLGFNHIKEFYEDDREFFKVFEECSKGSCKGFFIHEGSLFRGKNLCIPKGSLRKILIKEATRWTNRTLWCKQNFRDFKRTFLMASLAKTSFKVF